MTPVAVTAVVVIAVLAVARVAVAWWLVASGRYPAHPDPIDLARMRAGGDPR